jgi:hypothetical protein
MIYLFSIIILAGGFLVGTTPPPHSGLEIKISPNTPEVTIGHDVRIQFEFKNPSKGRVNCSAEVTGGRDVVDVLVFLDPRCMR